ncbi:MATE family efflux transporter [uncultured Porphyromonas sp.]|uniref:MATE family efflux transporter n=1 Tax=uncultured Porphyromonas sp. TaxID=159274 RepID=UPI0026143B05|nr:MATE family efflux transporter [uncultured Porphyromonas sp.]
MSEVSAINRRILKLALPNILSNLTVPLLGIVDLTLSGHLEDAYAIGAVAIATTMFNLIYWNFSFLRMGTTGLTAQSHGAGNHLAMGRNLMQSLLIALLGGLFILLLQKPILNLTLLILKPEVGLISYATTYYDIVVWGAPAVLCTLALNGWLIGMQNTWYPMVVSITTNVTNIAISACLVILSRKGITGIAFGTLVAQWIGVISLLTGAYLLYFKKDKVSIPQKIEELKIGLRRYFGTNLHIFLRTILISLISAFFTYAGSTQGALILAANALLYQSFTFFNNFVDGFAFAGEAIVGHYYGMKNRHLLRKSVQLLIVWGLGLALFTSLLYFIISEPFLAFLTDKEEVINIAQNYLIWVYLLPVMGFLAFLYDGVFVGITATREMLLSMLFAVMAFFALYFTLPFTDINQTLWASFVMYLLARGGCQILMSRKMVGLGKPFEYVYTLSIGTTILDSEEKIKSYLATEFPDNQFSSFYITDDVSKNSSKNYLNSVLRVKTSLTLDEMIAKTKQIESQFGRKKDASGEVALDVDVVLMDSQILRNKDFNRDYFQIGYNEIKTIHHGQRNN